ncbi:bifunctional riboflavin kinase/FAD synthetase [Oceanicella actignis]|uniref:Riboflavin biosynthesis protein n=1 Tax=Oceanicella actignis TaxID=1189325 RepID=A0A1M7TY58_9RHOB|nr:bifunctional riboflavin kinase/FAD synthetase [Oceanicella actignis]SET81621.1 riboflavin kinase / FMN adenylyltransferase [Oceanicella actignis]SHN75702.1 riboflavin kinase / FMN adenylyltransferase [Oceanicella actignis]
MRIIRGLEQVRPEDRGASTALGNFDGVHLGHQAVIDLARAPDAPLGVITFEPHPREFFAPDAPPFRLMNAAARAHRLEKLGVERLFELRFDAALAALSAEEFARKVLAEALGVKRVVVGADFRFGKGRAGDAETLRRLGDELGFEVRAAGLVRGPAGEEISSTAIRRALLEGRPEDARRMLGHWHRIDGEVRHGDKRGRELGFPTANLSLERLLVPRHGVYAVLVEVLDGPFRGVRQGAASIGVRPTFGINAPNLEVHLLDFSGDLYGAQISVALVSFIRPEEKFDDVEALIARMREDCAEARRRLAAASVAAS